jgi:hypothetical protein
MLPAVLDTNGLPRGSRPALKMSDYEPFILLVIALVFLVAVVIFWFTHWRKPDGS